jgi:hypothetical protein
MIKNVDYVVLTELPKEHQEPFLACFGLGTVPVIEKEGENKHKCFYKEDYDWFLRSLNPAPKITIEEKLKDLLRIDRDMRRNLK